MVLKKVEYSGNLNVNKLKQKFDGPYKIHKTINNGVTYELITDDNKIIRAHHVQLRKLRIPPDYINRFTTFDFRDEHNVLTNDIDITLLNDNNDFGRTDWIQNDEYYNYAAEWKLLMWKFCGIPGV